MVDLHAPIEVFSPLSFNNVRGVVLASSNGKGELSGRGQTRVMEVVNWAEVRLDSIVVRDGRTNYNNDGGCMRVEANSNLVVSTATITGCEAAGNLAVSQMNE